MSVNCCLSSVFRQVFFVNFPSSVSIKCFPSTVFIRNVRHFRDGGVFRSIGNSSFFLFFLSFVFVVFRRFSLRLGGSKQDTMLVKLFGTPSKFAKAVAEAYALKKEQDEAAHENYLCFGKPHRLRNDENSWRAEKRNRIGTEKTEERKRNGKVWRV